MSTLYVKGIRQAGQGSLFVAPTVADEDAPKISEFNGSTGFTIHCDLDTFSWSSTTEKVAKRPYCMGVSVQTFGDTTYEIEDLLLVCDPQEPDSDEYRAAASMVKGSKWVIADRRGFPADTALAADQYTHLLHVEVGETAPDPIGDEAGSYHRVRVPLIITRPVKQNAKFVAGP